MARSKEITPRKRAIIAQYVRDGLTVREIATRINIPKSTVGNIVKRFKVSGSSEAGKHTGRKRVTTRREDLLLKRAVMKHPSMSSLELKIECQSKASPQTIRRRLVKEFGLRSRRPARKPLLNRAQRLKRLAFCQKHRQWTATEWSKVMFSDESTFCQFGSFVNLVRRPLKTRFLPKYTVATVKHSPKVMLWGCFSATGRGSLYFVPQNQTVNGAEYLNILQTKLVDAMKIHRCEIFQQDSAPAHVCKNVKNWFSSNGIEVLEWPGNSPDLNPIENLWQIMKRKVRQHSPRNMQELIFYIKRVWCLNVTQDMCKRLVESMPRRINSVIKCKGNMSKY